MTSAATKTADLLDLLRSFKETRQAEYDLTALGIFGSFAREEATDDSDVDVVFQTNSPNLFRTARMQQELERLLARKVDVVQLREHMNPRLKQRIIRDAKYV